MPEFDHRADNGRIGLVQLHVGDERPVDLQLGDGQRGQQPEGRLTGAEVIDAHIGTGIADLSQDRPGPGRVDHEGGLGDLDSQPLRLDAGSLQGADDLAGETVVEIASRDVHRHGQPVVDLLHPAQVVERSAHHPSGQLVDEVGLLDERDEPVG